MKVRFSESLNAKLFVYPVVFLLAVFIAGGITFYFFSPLHYLKEFYRLHLVNLSSEKKLAVDTWIEQYRKNIEYLSKNQTLRDNLVILSIPPMSAQKNDRKMIGLAGREAERNVSQLLSDTALSSNSKMIALLSKEGKVIASTEKESIGQDWAERAVVKDVLSEPKPGDVTGFYNDGGAERGIINVSPVSDAGGIKAFIYSVPNIDKLCGLLRIESSFYKTEKVELLDRDGNLIVTKNGIPDKKLRYNIPKGYKENSVMLRDNFFFYVLNLDNVPFRLISIVERQEVMRPFFMLIVVFASFAVLMALVLVFQGAYLAPRLITRPAARLINAAKSAAEGNPDPDWGKGYTGEMLLLKNACEEMAGEWHAKESLLKGPVNPEAASPVVSEEFDMTGLLEEVEDKARAAIGSKEIELVVDCSEKLIGQPAYTDRLRLRELLENMIDHAVSSTETGTITLLLSDAVKDGIRYLEASVADTGRGAGQEELEEDADIVRSKNLAEALGGAVVIESEQDKGSVFNVTIPMNALLY